jgi:hypothetical protein
MTHKSSLKARKMVKMKKTRKKCLESVKALVREKNSLVARKMYPDAKKCLVSVRNA